MAGVVTLFDASCVPDCHALSQRGGSTVAATRAARESCYFSSISCNLSKWGGQGTRSPADSGQWDSMGKEKSKLRKFANTEAWGGLKPGFNESKGDAKQHKQDQGKRYGEIRRELHGDGEKWRERGLVAGGGAGYTCDSGKYEGLWQVLNGLAPRPPSTG